MSKRCAKCFIFVVKPRNMDIIALREYVLSFASVDECTPFDDVTLVYKVAGKMFLCVDMECPDHIVIHHSPERGEALRDEWGEIRPAWHFNKRYWSDVSVVGDLPESVVRMLIRESYVFTIHHNVTPKALRERALSEIE